MKSELDAPHFADETAAIEYVEARMWPNGPVCPHCGTVGGASRSKGKTTRPGLWNCRACRKPFTVRMRSIFESSHVPMRIWLQAIYLICSSKKGISTRQIQRTLGGSMKTAWFLMHRIRMAMSESGGTGLMGGPGVIVEADETFLTRSLKTRRPKDAPPRENRQVISLVERGGPIRSLYLDQTNIRGALWQHLNPDSTLHTDGAVGYRRFARHHHSVDHSKEEWVRELPDGTKVHTNTLEGFFSVFKRGLVGIYQHVDEKHLDRYLAEFDFRYNNRAKLGVDDKQRADRALVGAKGKRLTYQTTCSQEALDTPPF
ncbi:MAG TPA: IS1595 family transposase [Stellaceae bacterium]|nr:IS1595 family transposase [Stellaceae bacterium]